MEMNWERDEDWAAAQKRITALETAVVQRDERILELCKVADLFVKQSNEYAVLARIAAGHTKPAIWLPIESAPKDGTEILIALANAPDKVVGLFVHRAAWWQGDGWVVYNSNVHEQRSFFEPNLWMPIPGASPTVRLSRESE